MRRYLARQFSHPEGFFGRWLIAPWLNRIGREMNQAALAALDLRGTEGVLEVGFGGGDLLAEILALTRGEAIGVDPSEAVIHHARRRFRRARERLTLCEGTVDRLPIRDASVDKACSVNTLYFWDSPEGAMSELARVLRPGGRLVICAQTPESVRAWPGHVHGFRTYGGEEIAGLMEAAGFRQIRTASGIGRWVGSFFCIDGERP